MVRRTTSVHPSHTGHTIEHASFSGISTERATEIQSALIQRGYLTGEPTGTWDATSISAMQRVQADNGWQTKFVPDSRALIKLGLGSGSTPVSAGTGATSTAVISSPAAPVTY